MKSIKCPKCGCVIKGAAPVINIKVVKAIVKAAKDGASIETLASIYASRLHVSYSSGRRAIERLAKGGYLVRLSPGWYMEPMSYT